jgi:hypothetical protein
MVSEEESNYGEAGQWYIDGCPCWRKLRSIPQWCEKSPFFSMVPLGSDENIGEAVAGDFGSRRYPVWKSATFKPQRPTGMGHDNLQTN